MCSAPAGFSPPNRSGHSTIATPSSASSHPNSSNAPGPSSRHRSKCCTSPNHDVYPCTRV